MERDINDVKDKAKEKLDEFKEQGERAFESARTAGKEKVDQAKEKAGEFTERMKDERG